jgi:hypothetical protein
MSVETLISTSDFHVRMFDTQMRRGGRMARWEVSCNGSEYVPFPMRRLGEFVTSTTTAIVEALVTDSHDKHVVMSEQTAARLHVAGAIDLRNVHVQDGQLWMHRVAFGDYQVSVHIVPTAKPTPELAFGWEVVGPRHLHSV